MSATIDRSPSRARGLIAAAVLLTTAAIAGACTPPSTGGGTDPGTVKTITNASFEWTVSREADNGSFAPGEVNYWSAGESNSTASTYVATNGNATVVKKNAAGTYVPINSETSVNYANRTKDGAGNTVTATNAFYLGQKVRFTGGTGTVDTTSGASTIQWTGTFSINFYGKYVPFWITNPKLVVSAAGVGQITATVAGYASSLDDPDTRVALPASNVVIADLPLVSGANSTGFTAGTAFLGTAVSTPAGAPQIAKTVANTPFWGSWPQSFVNFQNNTGLGTYWYTSGGAADPKKAQEPVVVAYNLAP